MLTDNRKIVFDRKHGRLVKRKTDRQRPIMNASDKSYVVEAIADSRVSVEAKNFTLI